MEAKADWAWEKGSSGRGALTWEGTCRRKLRRGSRLKPALDKTR